MFLVVTVTLLPVPVFSVEAAKAGTVVSLTALVSLLVCLIPTTIGGLLSAVGVAGMSRMMQANVIATSGRAVEAAGDVDVLLLDKTGTITHGNRQASLFVPAPGITEARLARVALLASLHFKWLEGLRFETAVQQIVFQEYFDMVKHTQGRVAAMEEEMRRALTGWTLQPVVEGLMALRGVSLVTAMTLMAELGDLSRFESPRQLMSHLGLVPSEHSSGERQKRGGITKTGNSHVRRVLVEASWTYKSPARKTAHLQRKAEKTSKVVQEIAWKAQKRLCSRYWYLINKGKLPVKSCIAVARELVGFIWAIAREVMGKGNISVAMNG